MFSNGNSFSGNSNFSECQAGLVKGERRNTEPWLWRLLCQVQPGAVA
ncbi:MAG TPA: hypothetical protein VFQ68_11040 [Streptosporangiaceae bacterium]|nr:hypothetical protein [Streptosporangiaceae bacterium]